MDFNTAFKKNDDDLETAQKSNERSFSDPIYINCNRSNSGGISGNSELSVKTNPDRSKNDHYIQFQEVSQEEYDRELANYNEYYKTAQYRKIYSPYKEFGLFPLRKSASGDQPTFWESHIKSPANTRPPSQYRPHSVLYINRKPLINKESSPHGDAQSCEDKMISKPPSHIGYFQNDRLPLHGDRKSPFHSGSSHQKSLPPPPHNPPFYDKTTSHSGIFQRGRSPHHGKPSLHGGSFHHNRPPTHVKPPFQSSQLDRPPFHGKPSCHSESPYQDEQPHYIPPSQDELSAHYRPAFYGKPPFQGGSSHRPQLHDSPPSDGRPSHHETPQPEGASAHPNIPMHISEHSTHDFHHLYDTSPPHSVPLSRPPPNDNLSYEHPSLPTNNEPEFHHENVDQNFAHIIPSGVQPEFDNFGVDAATSINQMINDEISSSPKPAVIISNNLLQNAQHNISPLSLFQALPVIPINEIQYGYYNYYYAHLIDIK
ncbi:jg8513 [Pararge aegeria aegeria]|uniref:Jg8513 protein n=1 Tax=Pararge aegeria aegeria TaxID=348720 RepID=A0A8S4RBU5_9NEOP|nr:jg8513 [Pararge aegeria aegeria]